MATENNNEQLKSSIALGTVTSIGAATALATTTAQTSAGVAVLAGGGFLSAVALPALVVGATIAAGYTILSSWDEIVEWTKDTFWDYGINEELNGVTKDADTKHFAYTTEAEPAKTKVPVEIFRRLTKNLWGAISGYEEVTGDACNEIEPITGDVFLANFQAWLLKVRPNEQAVNDWIALTENTERYNLLKNWLGTTSVGLFSACYTRTSGGIGYFLFYHRQGTNLKPYPRSAWTSNGNYYIGAQVVPKENSMPVTAYSSIYTAYGAGWKFYQGLTPTNYVVEGESYNFIYSSNGVKARSGGSGIEIEKDASAAVNIADYADTTTGAMSDAQLSAFVEALQAQGATVETLQGAITDLSGAVEDLQSIGIAIGAEGVTAGTQADVLTGTTAADIVAKAEAAATRVAKAAAEATAPVDPDNAGNTPAPVLPVDRGGLDIFTIYAPTDAQLKSFGQWLWAGILENIFDSLKKLYQNPFDAIIGLSEIYVTPTNLTTSTINLGKIDSEVSASVVNNKYVSLQWKPLKIPEIYNNVYDYDYTSISIFLPFIGITPLDTPDIMGKTVNLGGVVDVSTGMLVYNITITDSYSNVTQLQYIYSGNCAVQKPITGANYNNVLNGLLGVAAGAVTGGAGLAASAAGAAGAAFSGVGIKKSGSIGANFGAMTTKTPFILVTHKIPYDPAMFNNYYGYPANKNVLLSDCSGYTRVKSIQLAGIEATTDEINEIETLLKSGVYI